MSGPVTEAGKTFASEVAFTADDMGFRWVEAHERVVAIENEARQQERERLRAKVAQSPGFGTAQGERVIHRGWVEALLADPEVTP
jgi:hypothetical protein